MKTMAMKSLTRLTTRDPTLFPAASKESAVTVQKQAVNNAANSPDPINQIPFAGGLYHKMDLLDYKFSARTVYRVIGHKTTEYR